MGGELPSTRTQARARRVGYGRAMLKNRRPVLALLLLAVAVPGVALAAGKPPAPKAGVWKISGGGGFHVTRKRDAITAFHIPGGNCGLKELHVAGRQRLRTTTAAGYTNWIVGKGDPSRKNPADLHGVVGTPVKIHMGRKTLHGRLGIIFRILGHARDNLGDLVVSGCDIPFTPGR